MFTLPKETILDIISGRISYNDPPICFANEGVKGFRLQYQSKINMKLENSLEAECRATITKCMKEDCRLYFDKPDHLQSWACKEYQVDYPSAGFDSGLHIALRGADRINVEASIENIEILRKRGGNFACSLCSSLYEQKPDICRTCDSSAFEDVDSFLKKIKEDMPVEDIDLVSFRDKDGVNHLLGRNKLIQNS